MAEKVVVDYKSYSDEVLLDLVIRGNRPAYAEIYNRYKGLLYVHACRMLKDSEDAEDIVHDLFAALWNKKEQLEINQLRYYLYSSLRNRILKFLAHKKVGASYLGSLPVNIDYMPPNTDYLVREQLLRALIEQEIDKLPTKMRAVFELSRKANLTHKEIAEKLDISEQTVRKHIQHALKILKQKVPVLILFFFLP